jgi:peptide/nickel transport system substrate-binding protein
VALKRSRSRLTAPSRTNRRLTLVAVASLVAVLAVGAGTSGGATKIDSATPTSLIIGDSIEPGNLDVQLTSTAVVNEALYNIYDALTQFNRKVDAAPALAVSWKNLTPTTWRFNLRKGVKFQNGEKFTPAAAVYSITRAVVPTSMNLGYYSLLKGASVIKGQNAILIETTAPDPNIPAELTFLPMVPPNYVQTQLDEYLKHPIGTGPYKFDHWDRGQELVVTRNPTWWGGKARYAKVTFRLIPDANVRVQALRANEINFASGIAPAQVSQVPQAFTPPSNTVCVIRLNNQSEPFNNLNIRKAANYAIDRKKIVSSLFGRLAAVSHAQVVGQASFGYDPKLQDYPYSVTQAKALLAQGGYKNQPITLLGPSGHWTGDRDVMLTAANYLQQAGFNVKPQIVEFSVWRAGYFATPRPDAAFVCTGDDGFTGFRPLINLATPNGPQTAYVNQAIGDKIAQAQSTFNDAKRRTLMRSIWSALKADAFAVPIASVKQIYGAQRNIYWRTPLHGRVYANDIIILKKNR